MPSDTYTLTISDFAATAPSTGSVVNDSVAANAAIAFSKLATLTSGNILVGNSSNVPTSVSLTGNVTVSNTGVATIANDAITFGKMQNVSGYTILGKPTTGSGDVAEIGSSSYMLEASTGFLRQADATTARSTLGLGAIAIQTNSPTLVAPILGTPAAGSTLTNCTGLPISTGVSGLGTGVATFLATPSSANLRTAVTDETGSGALVFASSPTLVTPNIGVAAGTSLLTSASIKSVGTAGIGYASGSGGQVTQATSKSTSVTLDTINGSITMNNASLAHDTVVSFTLSNNTITVDDVLILNHSSGGTAGEYLLNARCANGSAIISVKNTKSSALSEAIVIAFVVIKAATTSPV